MHDIKIYCVWILTSSSILLLAEQNVKVSRALGAERQQQGLQYRRGAGEAEQHGPHVVVTEHEVQTYYLHPPTHTHRNPHTEFGLYGC